MLDHDLDELIGLQSQTDWLADIWKRKQVPCIKFHHLYITTLGQLDSTA